MNKYRIKKVEESNYGTHYKIQKRIRFMWIGPNVWEIYDAYDDNCWHCFGGTKFYDLEETKRVLKSIIRRETNEIVSNETVFECNTLKDLE